jgi:hypothetical protein
MTRLAAALALLTLSLPALAAEDEPKPPAGGDPMAGWAPRKVAREAQDKKEIEALLKAMDDAGKKGDLDAAVALVDFPVLMVTDDSKGQARGETWTKEQWVKVMQPFFKPNPDMKMTHHHTIFLVTDSLATVDDQGTMTMGPKKIASRSSTLLIRKDGKWRVKSMIEGGWGDAMSAPQAADQEKAPAQGAPDAPAK